MSGTTLETTSDGPTTRVAVHGELDLEEAATLRDATGRAFAQGAQRVVVDLAGVTFVDSSGLQGLVWLDGPRQAGQELVLARPSEALERLFRMTGLGERFTFTEDA